MTDDATMRSDLGRLRTFIHQGKLRKIQNLLKNQSKRINYLLEHEFDACAYAAKFKQEHLIPILHEYGFPLDGYPRTRTITALIIAIRRCDFDCVQTLVTLGCDVNCSVRSYTIIPILESYQTYRNKRDNLFLSEKAKSIFRYLLQSGASPNVYNSHSLRLVHLTVIDGEFELLQSVLDHGAHIYGYTLAHRKNLLHLVCERSTEDDSERVLQVTRDLIARGCNINHRDDCFETPLMCTLHHGGNLALAHELIVEGTILDLKNNFGNTFLTRAVHYTLYDHARMALYAGAPCRAWQCSFPYINRYYQQQQTPNQTSLMDAIIDYEKFIREMECYLLKPRRLKDIARITIRNALPCPLSQSTIQLNDYLPASLIDYLMLKEMKTMLNLRF